MNTFKIMFAAWGATQVRRVMLSLLSLLTILGLRHAGACVCSKT